MRHHLIGLGLVVGLLTGCASLQQAKADHDAAKADLELAGQVQTEKQTLMDTLYAVTPAPLKSALPVVSVLLGPLLLVRAGRRKRLGTLGTTTRPFFGFGGKISKLEDVTQLYADATAALGVGRWAMVALIPAALLLLPPVMEWATAHETAISLMLTVTATAVGLFQKTLDKVIPPPTSLPTPTQP